MRGLTAWMVVAAACGRSNRTTAQAIGSALPGAAHATETALSATALSSTAGVNLPRSGTGAQAFGINEAVAVPRALVERGAISEEGEQRELAADARQARALGGSIVRANSPVYPFLDMQSLEATGGNWTRADRWMRVVGDAGLDAVMVLGPWPGNRTASYTETYLPGDLTAYEAYVRRVVERYDGDGVDDMPGLVRPVKHWEVDNEPDLHNSAPPKGAPQRVDPSHFETPVQYATVLLATARAIRQADPEARVLSGGLYRAHTQQGRAYMEQVLREPGAAAAFDVLSLHCYFDEDSLLTVDRTLSAARSLAPDKPVWITETSVPSDGRKPWADEAWQARMVAGIIGAALGGGAERVFWHTLSDPPPSTDQHRTGTFATNSLLRTTDRTPGKGGDREAKPAGEVYRRLAELLGPVDLSTVTDEQTSTGRLLRTPQGALAYWGTPRAPAGAREVTDLLTGQIRPLTDGAAIRAPSWVR